VREDLITWQWEGYPSFHRSRLNLAVHLVAVPAFEASVLSVGWSLLQLAWASATFSLGVAAVAFAAQAVGHGKEQNPAIPFAGPSDALSRIFLEQFFTFPRFVVTGGWWRAWQGNAAAPR
jgi:uncharacterized membrane protein YGL010W